MKVMLTGSGSGLGRRVTSLLADRGDIVEAAGIDRAVIPADADVVVHLSAGDHDALAARETNALVGFPELLASMTTAGVDHLVLLSSAMVYGAWPNNPVPLTEDSPVRPDSSFVFAQHLAQVEELADEWRTAAPGRTVAVLRPVLFLSAEGDSSVVRALAAGMGHRFGEEDPPAQFLHLDDLASAIDVAVATRLDGIHNVAPDGWITGERVRALAGDGPRIKLPGRVADQVGHLRWRFERGPIPPGLMPYAGNPWLVANDRMKQAGWRPTITNEQAYVEGTDAKWWTMLTPKRKQELALGAMVAATVGVILVLMSLVRSSRRSRRRDRDDEADQRDQRD